MPTRLRLAAGDREWTLEISEPDVRLADVDRSVTVTREPDGYFVADTGSRKVRGAAVRHGHEVWVTIDGRVFVFAVGRRHGQASAVEHDALTVAMPATVVRVAVRPGQAVRQGDLLVGLEAMKMELAIRAPRDGVVRAVHCHEGDLVPPGRPLIEL
jgi:3-methylcrotonyl-CoA carboxylase alpha subunit